MISEFENGWIVVERTNQFFGYFGTVSVFIDQAKVGTIRNGERKVLELAPGEYTVFAKFDLDSVKTPPLKVTVEAGESVYLSCGSPLKGWWLFASWVGLLVWWNRWIYLVREL